MRPELNTPPPTGDVSKKEKYIMLHIKHCNHIRDVEQSPCFNSVFYFSISYNISLMISI